MRLIPYILTAADLIWKRKSNTVKMYANLDNISNVLSYELGADYIKVTFRQPQKIIKYSYRSAGELHIDEMKFLAQTGRGLGEYISKNLKVKNNHV